MQKDALKSSFTNRQGKNEVQLPEVPQEMKVWEPKKLRGKAQQVKSSREDKVRRNLMYI